jgi:integration host factor subunit alpha
MTLTKTHVFETIVDRTGLTLKKSIDSVECLLEIIKSALENGDDVLVSGFGKFCVKQKQPHISGRGFLSA